MREQEDKRDGTYYGASAGEGERTQERQRTLGLRGRRSSTRSSVDVLTHLIRHKLVRVV